MGNKKSYNQGSVKPIKKAPAKKAAVKKAPKKKTNSKNEVQ